LKHINDFVSDPQDPIFDEITPQIQRFSPKILQFLWFVPKDAPQLPRWRRVTTPAAAITPPGSSMETQRICHGGNKPQATL
jgi:hypothetical protein